MIDSVSSNSKGQNVFLAIQNSHKNNKVVILNVFKKASLRRLCQMGLRFMILFTYMALL